MDGSEEDYDDSREEPLSKESSQPSQTLPSRANYSRPSKRRKTSDSGNDSIEDFVVYENTSRSRKSRRADIEENSPGEFERQVAQKRKSKYKIHIPRDNAAPSVTVQYGTQQQDNLDSSPYRIRGPKWKRPKVAATKSSRAEPQNLRQDRTGALFKRNSVFEGSSSPDPVASESAHFNEITTSFPLVQDNAANILGPSVGISAAASVNEIARELEDLPSDAFLSSPDASPSLHPINPQFRSQKRLVGPQIGLRQTTLFGGKAAEDDSRSSQVNKVHNYRVDMVPEAPTHHQLDHEALKTWVYPTNLGPTRDYQFNIVRQGLFNNMLVALPTGLGKTFIAATIMLNYFRWTKDSQIVFMAPTKPLVSQQVEACFKIAGIPRSATTMLTGEISPALRGQEWEDKRVFFMTPQTLENDLRTGVADPKKIVLLVVDEAHRATGNYSYIKVVSFMRTFSKSFRILALTATPGASVEAVQEVIDGLEISKVEIRTEESMDIQPFTHRRNIEQVLLDPSDEIIMVKDLLSKALKPLVDKLCAQNAYWNKDPMSLTPYGLLQAQKSWSMSEAGRRASFGLKGMVSNLIAILSSIAHGIKLLNFHGIGPFYGAMKDFRTGVENQGNKAGKYRKLINDNPHFQTLMTRIETWINKDDFVGHPKLTYLCDTILNHFLDAGEGRLPIGAPHSSTRVIVFAEYRDSAEEICRVLNRHKPMIRASVFVGQADSKRSEGMNQLKQIGTIDKFKTGDFNVLVATSIGEEGLDIGQVDLIVCYDASGSPIRMLQRMGRTGRKRAGNIVLLLMRGKEEESFIKSKDNYEQMQKMIASGSRFNFRHDLATRIVPKDISPKVDKRHVEIPLENTQDNSLPVPKRRATKPKKKPAKKFHMPDGVETGFRKASMLSKADRGSQDSDDEASETLEDQRMPIPIIDSVLLSDSQMKELERSYQNVHGDEMQEVSMPETTFWPEFQRSLGPSKFVRHGRAAKHFVNMVRAMRSMSDTILDQWQRIFEDEGPVQEQLASASQSPAPSLVSSLTSLAMQFGSENVRAQNSCAKASKGPIGRAVSSLTEDLSETGGSSDDQDRDEDDDLDGFVVADKEPLHRRHTTSTLSSSPPPDFPPPKMKLFFEPTTFTATQDTNDDDDAMPDLTDLLGSKDAHSLPDPQMHSRVNVKSDRERGRSGRRRQILEDEDSDE